MVEGTQLEVGISRFAKYTQHENYAILGDGWGGGGIWVYALLILL